MAATAVHSAWRWSRALFLRGAPPRVHRLGALSAGLVLAASAAGMPALATVAADLREGLEDIYQEDAIQRELPEEAARESGVRFVGAPYAFFALFAAAAMVLLAVWLVDADWERLGERLAALRGRGGKEGGARPPPANRDRYRQADQLAASGQWAEAIHMVLIAALADLAAGARWPNAATAREIAARPRAGDDLRTLVAAAELAHFGGRAATLEQYRRARACALRIEACASARGGARGAGTDGIRPAVRDGFAASGQLPE